MNIDIKDAVKAARVFAQQLFDQESLKNLALEEVELDADAGEWLVTLGYDSPNRKRKTTTGPSLFPTVEELNIREYKIFRIAANDGHLVSMRLRDV
jgi:hypothetical protein